MQNNFTLLANRISEKKKSNYGSNYLPYDNYIL